ncbi:sodium:proton antiporter NhaD [Streptomyces caniscabiei]|uniref:sodium:proton antiporter NhaD n=1 Tax=Streptomyces caniscabiei TaxID=2746961 RepID=UPI0029AD1C0E|nr:sodium:proton antiporter NhaD [Streptomyces caniscabiei]MDX2776496.1 sodium:proton antiporter NhaD [Streptomyces caniscabiei]
MELLGIIAAGFFGLGYVLITLEQKFNTHKSAIALTLGAVLWLLAAVHLTHERDVLSHALSHAGAEIFNIVAFLLAALALIEILVHYKFFDLIRAKLIALNVGDRQQFILVMALTFVFSGILDNIAITIAMLQIALRFFKGKNMIIAAAGIVVAANAGGAWSPVGDVTTIMLWLAGKFTALEVIRYAFLPSAALALVAGTLLYRKLDDTSFEKREKDDMVTPSLGERLVITMALVSFVLPLIVSFIGLPPYMGLFLGLGLTWMMIEFAKKRKNANNPTHMTANIDKIVQSVDISSIKYIMGILLAVMALSTLGVLQWLSHIVVGTDPSTSHLVLTNMGLGFLSGIVDNASLVAIAMNTLPMTDPELWALTAIAAGNGGSLFVIASAAGVVAMGGYRQLTMGEYFKVATVPVFLGLLVAFGVWYLQFTFL